MSPTNKTSLGASALPSWAATRFLNCERFERRYDARNDGFFASRRRRKCAQSNRVAASAVSVSALRRELPRSHKHRVCDAWNERRPGFKRFSVWHGQRNFFYWIFCAANSRGAAGGTLERQTSPRDNADNLGRTHNTHWFCPHAAGALRRAFPARRSGGRLFPRCDCLSFALVRLSGSGQGGGAVYVGYSHCLHSRRASCRHDPACSLARHCRMAMALPAGRRARDLTWNRDIVRAAGSA